MDDRATDKPADAEESPAAEAKEIPMTETLEAPEEQRDHQRDVEAICKTANRHLAELGCHDSVAKFTIRALAKTMVYGPDDN